MTGRAIVRVAPELLLEALFGSDDRVSVVGVSYDPERHEVRLILSGETLPQWRSGLDPTCINPTVRLIQGQRVTQWIRNDDR